MIKFVTSYLSCAGSKARGLPGTARVLRILPMRNTPLNKGEPRAGASSHEAAPALESIEKEHGSDSSAHDMPLFENPFFIEDLQVFDDPTMQRLLRCDGFGLTLEDLAWSLHGVSTSLVKRIRRNVPAQQRASFAQELRRPIAVDQVKAARQRVLHGLFWELTYWKTPNLYEELTEGEQLHPGIFQQLAQDLRGNIVLDAGAGSGRASFACLRRGARLVYAMEPSPGLLRILQQKAVSQRVNGRIVPCQGRFEQIPLEDDSVDLALSCSAFTAQPEQGGEPGLAELKRVTKSGGKIVLIWPRQEDLHWLIERGFQYVSLPVPREMRVHFRSLQSALRCARIFYARNGEVLRYLLKKQKPEVPYSVLGINPPCDYCWLSVE
jgi:ubiquinone/menaquinone biosynthesis C-methylase UbiE